MRMNVNKLLAEAKLSLNEVVLAPEGSFNRNLVLERAEEAREALDEALELVPEHFGPDLGRVTKAYLSQASVILQVAEESSDSGPQLEGAGTLNLRLQQPSP